MSFDQALQAESEDIHGGSKCTVYVALSILDDDDRVIAERAIDEKVGEHYVVSARKIAGALTKETKVIVKQPTIQRHRRRDCKCRPPVDSQ